MRKIILVLIVMLSISGCYRTVYLNVQGDKNPTKVTLEQIEKLPDYENSDWLHYFVNGLAPDERIINAAQTCGGAEHITGITTRQTFLQGLVHGATTYYVVSIYTPYDGHVVCDNTKISKQ